MLKKILGIAPTLESDGSYSPSKLALKMGVADKTVCADRGLITGASPLASNELGKLAVKTMLEKFN